MSDFWAWFRCCILHRDCPWRPIEPDPIVVELRARTNRANRQADTLRRAREEGRTLGRREFWDEPTRDAALTELWGPPPWRDGGRRDGA